MILFNESLRLGNNIFQEKLILISDYVTVVFKEITKLTISDKLSKPMI